MEQPTEAFGRPSMHACGEESFFCFFGGERETRRRGRRLVGAGPILFEDDACVRRGKFFWGVEGGGRCLLGAARPLAERE